MLIDSATTHNFISTDLVNQLKLPLDTTSGYEVVMGTRLFVKGAGVCKGVRLSLQSVEIVEDFLPLELGSSDIILGMQWLETLGAMTVS